MLYAINPVEVLADQDIVFMSRALELAKIAMNEGEVPVGAVVVLNGEIIGEGRNAPIRLTQVTAHAEMQALEAACHKMTNYRLPGTRLYSTLEPCPMCAGAIVHARVDQVIFGAQDIKTGAAGGLMNIFAEAGFNHHTRVVGGVMRQECARLLTDFFQMRRSRKN